MKLSEAIKTGAALRPQAFDTYVDSGAGDMPCTCALGAAFEALTGQLPCVSDYGGVLDVIIMGVDGLSENDDILGKVLVWNDEEKLSREQIAERLEGMGL